MAKVDEVAKRSLLPPCKERSEEVFSMSEKVQIGEALGLNKNTVGWVLWHFGRRGLVRKEKVGRKVYYGCFEAINKLNKKM